MFVQLVSAGDDDAHSTKLIKTTFKQTAYAQTYFSKTI